jgi:hypothetical protein
MALKKRKPKRKVVRKRPVKRKTAKKKTVKRIVAKVSKKPAPKKSEGNVVGVVTHYFPKVNAAVVKLKAPLAPGDTIKIKGHTTDFTQQVASMQIDHVPITSAKKGDEIGLLVDSRARQGDKVYKP